MNDYSAPNNSMQRTAFRAAAESDRLASDPDERYIETAYHAENRVTGEQLTVAIDFRVIV